MKLFNGKGKFIGDLKFTPSNEKSRPQGNSNPGCAAALVLNLAFLVYAILHSDEAGPTWYWVLSWLILPLVPYAVLSPLTPFAERSCLGMLIGMILALVLPTLIILFHAIATAVIFVP
jgi:hypothetical protein